MTDEMKSDLTRMLQRQYQHGHDAGLAMGREMERTLTAAMRRDTVVIAFAIGAALGLLAGISL